ncbi:MAG TPA: outer membrane beta-barrel protein [Saprospiraceae bacterium]|nr:outer membrane beta-barrel protein [Saprospiraceae bacterium]
MKKLICLLFLSLVIFNIATAQEKLRFGFEVSPFLSWMSSDIKTVESQGGHLGLNIVADGEYKFGTNYAIRLGLGLSFAQGGSLKHNEINGFGNLFPNSNLSSPSLDSIAHGTIVKYRIQYIEVPFALKMCTPEYGNYKFFAEVPSLFIGFRTTAQADIGNATDENITRDAILINLGWGLGAGVEYSLNSSTSLLAGIYYQGGFTDVTKDDGADKNKANTNRVVLRIGVLF